MTYYLKGKDNQRVNSTNKTTIDKRIIAKKVLKELNDRIERNEGLKDVETVHLIKFLQSVMPKEGVVQHDWNINYKSATPRPAIIDNSSKVIDITPKPTV